MASKKADDLKGSTILWFNREPRSGQSHLNHNDDEMAEWNQSSFDQSFKSNVSSPSSHENATSPNEKLSTAADLRRKLAEMYNYVEQGQILEARKMLLAIKMIEKSNPLNPRISERHHLKAMQDVKERSDMVRYFLDLFYEDEGWTYTRRKSGVTVHVNREAVGTRIFLTRAQTTFNNFTSKDFIHFVTLFEETDLMPHWFPRGIIKSNSCLCQVSKFAKILHIQITFPMLAFLDDRDAVIESRGYHLLDENAVIIISRSIDESEHCQLPFFCSKEKVPRANVLAATMIEFLPTNQAIYRNLSRIDLKLYTIPLYVTNLLTRGGFQIEEISAIRHHLEYFHGSAWHARMKQRQNFYTDLEKRVVSRARQKLNGHSHPHRPTSSMTSDPFYADYENRYMNGDRKKEIDHSHPHSSTNSMASGPFYSDYENRFMNGHRKKEKDHSKRNSPTNSMENYLFNIESENRFMNEGGKKEQDHIPPNRPTNSVSSFPFTIESENRVRKGSSKKNNYSKMEDPVIEGVRKKMKDIKLERRIERGSSEKINKELRIDKEQYRPPPTSPTNNSLGNTVTL